jgi:hypothetical protein
VTLAMAEKRSTREGKPERGRLEGGLIRAGVVAGAIAGIVGAITAVLALLPDDPPKRAATFENVVVDRGVPLSEFNARVGDVTRSAYRGGEGVRLLLVAQETEGGAEGEAPPPEDGSAPGQGAPDQGAPEDPAGDETTDDGSAGDGATQDDTGTDGSTPGQFDSEDADAPARVHVTPAEAAEQAPELLGDDAEATVDEDGNMDIEDGDTRTAVLALTDAPDFGDAADRDTPITAVEVARVFKATRTDGREPIGVTVNFDLGAVGYEGKRLDVRWSLYSARTRRRVPREWLQMRRALLVKPDVEDARTSATFWVPLPRAHGPWFVRLAVFDSRGARVTFADTKRFG